MTTYVLIDKTGAEVAYSEDYDRVLRHFHAGTLGAVELARLDGETRVVLRRKTALTVAHIEEETRTATPPKPKAAAPKPVRAEAPPRPPKEPRAPRPRRDGSGPREGQAPCEGCGKVIEGKTRRVRFCSWRCGERHRRGQQPAVALDACKVCGGPMPGGRALTTCSDACRKKHHSLHNCAVQRAASEARQAERACVECGRRGLPPGRRAFCSDACCNAHHERRSKATRADRRPVRVAGECGCGAPLPPPYANTGAYPERCARCAKERHRQRSVAAMRGRVSPSVPLPASYVRLLGLVGPSATVGEVETRTGYARSTVLSMLARLTKRGDLRRLRPGVYARAT